MNRNSIHTAKMEAIRFLKKVDDLEILFRDPRASDSLGTGCGMPESAALRRASMDLTRALARLRKPG